MGQAASATNNHNWASSVEMFFKNFKMESQIIPTETVDLIKSNLEKGDVKKASSVITAALKDIDNASLRIAVTGESGSGKSSFINAVREVGFEDDDAATTGVVETTMKITEYKHPRIPSVILCDLPGIGTTKFKPEEYLKKMKFDTYDFFIIISAIRFTENDSRLATVIGKMKKHFYFVRAKVDLDLSNQEKFKPKTFCRREVLQKIRNDCLENLQEIDLKNPRVFLISNTDVTKYDFPKLHTALLEELPSFKRSIFIQCLPTITIPAIERKKDSLKQKIWLEALKAGTTATIPFMGLIIDNDMEKLNETLSFYRYNFRVDDVSLEKMAEDLNMSLEEIKSKLKSPHLLSIEKEDEPLETKLLKVVETFCSVNGGILATGIYFGKTFYWHNYFLDNVVDDAKNLLEKYMLKDSK